MLSVHSLLCLMSVLVFHAQVQEWVDQLGAPDTIVFLLGFNDVKEDALVIEEKVRWAATLGKRAVFAWPVDTQGNAAYNVRFSLVVFV